TLLFVDLVDSTPLAGRIGPEAFGDVVQRYHLACREAVIRQGGHVARLLGDGVLAYFGYPRAQEDDPVRAVRAARDALEAVSALAAALERELGVRLAARAAAHTGRVLVSQIGDHDTPEVFGETPAVAARLQSLADPQAVVVSAATHRLVRQSFACESL